MIDFFVGEIINSKIRIKNISFEDMSTLNFQVGQEIKIDNEDYYVTSINANCLYERAEITAIKVK